MFQLGSNASINKTYQVLNSYLVAPNLLKIHFKLKNTHKTLSDIYIKK